MVPGHEIVGRVTHIGNGVTKFKVGDLAGVGCMVDSCRECGSCREGEEQYCERGETVFTYNGRFKDGTPTYGGYSDARRGGRSVRAEDQRQARSRGDGAAAVRRDHDVFAAAALERAARASSVAWSGLGGLGHMALKFAHAFGAHVTQFTTSPARKPTRGGSARTKS